MISIIIGDIVVRYMSEERDEQLFETVEPIVVSLSTGDILRIPPGFETDFASVPKILWSFIGPIGKFNLASIIHDYFYTTHIVSRKFADDEFLRFMDYTNRSAYTRNRVMWFFVRIFGSNRWKKYGNASI